MVSATNGDYKGVTKADLSHHKEKNYIVIRKFCFPWTGEKVQKVFLFLPYNNRDNNNILKRWEITRAVTGLLPVTFQAPRDRALSGRERLLGRAENRDEDEK